MSDHTDCTIREHQARHKIGQGSIGTLSGPLGPHTISFQPRGSDKNQDRVVTDVWELHGQLWLFLAVFDGHLGPRNVEYTSRALPTAIRRKLRSYIHHIGGRLDRSNIVKYEPKVTALLRAEIEKFDKGLGDAVRKVCPRPSELSEEQARRLIEEHRDILERAFCGTTMAFALVNIDQRFMWAAGVGDSSVGLSTVDSDGKAHSQRLCEMHTFKSPREYFRATMAHPSVEQPLFDWEDRILGWMSVARAIGDFSLKLPVSYLTHVFQYLPGLEDFPFADYIPKILTPPYIISEPSVRYTDLQPVWRPDTKIFLFTDGVDSLVDGWLVFKPREHSGADPIDVVSALLADEIDPRIEEILGHKVISRWSGRENNRATDVLGNLLGGTDVERLEMVTNMDLLDNESNWPFHIDDTSIVVWRTADHSASSPSSRSES